MPSETGQMKFLRVFKWLDPTGNLVKTERQKSLVLRFKTYSVIFELIDDIKALLSGLMSPIISEEVTGQAEVREIFVVAKVGTIAGCKVVDGYIATPCRCKIN